MKVIAFLVALFSVTSALKPTESYTALKVRGGGEIGPLDGDLAMQLSKTAATAYVAGAGSKYIASQTGGSSTQVSLIEENWTGNCSLSYSSISGSYIFEFAPPSYIFLARRLCHL